MLSLGPADSSAITSSTTTKLLTTTTSPTVTSSTTTKLTAATTLSSTFTSSKTTTLTTTSVSPTITSSTTTKLLTTTSSPTVTSSTTTKLTAATTLSPTIISSKTTTLTTTSSPTITSSTTTKLLTTTNNICNSNPCRNGGTCSPKPSSREYQCLCAPGYQSTICDVEVNECLSSPCYPFGVCKDLINDYQCTCNGGYEPVINNTKVCTAIDYCSNTNQPCKNDGTCVNQNEVGRYYCICTGDYVGLQCNTPLNPVKTPTVNQTSPTSGIIAGGTNIIITGTNMNSFEPLGAYLKDTTEPNPLPSQYAFVIINKTRSDSIVVLSPPVNESYINRSLALIVQYSGPTNVTNEKNEFRFIYTGNPVINSIEPKDILAIGGVYLTISGSNMDVVQEPKMNVTAIVFNKTTNSKTSNYSQQSCNQKNNSSMICIFPQGIVPSAFYYEIQPFNAPGVFRFSRSFHNMKSRREKRAPVSNLTDHYGSRFELYLGFIFDYLPTYKDINKPNPSLSLTLVPTKINFTSTGVIEFDPKKEEIIRIKGNELTYGCSKDDYKVNVDDELCNIVDMTNNELLCKPPKEAPKRSKDSELQCKDKTHLVKAKVGGTEHKAGCLVYTAKSSNLGIILGVILPVVLLCVALALIFIFKRCRNKQKKQESECIAKKSDDGKQSEINPEPVDRSDCTETNYVIQHHNNYTPRVEPISPENRASYLQPVDPDYIVMNSPNPVTVANKPVAKRNHSKTNKTEDSHGYMVPMDQRMIDDGEEPHIFLQYANIKAHVSFYALEPPPDYLIEEGADCLNEYQS